MAGSASYCAVKAGLDHLSRALALEAPDVGIVSLAGTNGFCLIDSEPPAMGEDITVYLY